MDAVVQSACHGSRLARHWKTNILQAKYLDEDLSVCFRLILSPVFPDFLGILVLNDTLVAVRSGELQAYHIRRSTNSPPGTTRINVSSARKMGDLVIGS